MKAVIEKSKYPIVLRDYLSIGKRKARVKIEIHEDRVTLLMLCWMKKNFLNAIRKN